MATKLTNVSLKATQMIGRPITWAQLNLAASEDLRGLISRNPKAAQLVLALIERMIPGSGGVVVVSRTAIAEILETSLRTVDRSLAMLAEEGWVQKMRIGGAFALAINQRVAWVGNREDIQHAVFSATVIASRSEQDSMGLAPPPIRQVPILQPGEMPLMQGPGLDPPSQPELDGMPPIVVYQNELESRGQMPLNIDPETGEIFNGEIK
jgi:DNA-binding transcriptional regulator YhcF (GntR family)